MNTPTDSQLDPQHELSAPTPEDEAAEATPLEQPSEVDVLKEEVAVLKDRYLRQVAEFENFKKRSERERQNSVRFASENLLQDLLPVLDHLEQALVAAEKGEQGHAGYSTVITGVKMVLKQFQDVLGRHGIQSFSAKGQTFDPTRHEAVLEREEEGAKAGQVLEEFQKGYLLHERLVRPARVVVAKAS